MKKINGGYQSLFEYLGLENFPFAHTLDTVLYPVEHFTLESASIKPYFRRYNETPQGYWADQFIGSLQPIASILNIVKIGLA